MLTPCTVISIIKSKHAAFTHAIMKRESVHKGLHSYTGEAGILKKHIGRSYQRKKSIVLQRTANVKHVEDKTISGLC